MSSFIYVLLLPCVFSLNDITPMLPEHITQCHEERLARFPAGTEYHMADELVPGVWVGSVCASRNETFLREKQISLALSVANEWNVEGMNLYTGHEGTLYFHIAGLLDDPAREKEEQVLTLLQDAVVVIQYWREHEPWAAGSVLIYCNMGVSRSVTVALAYLMLDPGFARQYSRNKDPLYLAQQKRPVANPNWLYRQVLYKIHDVQHMSHEWL